MSEPNNAQRAFIAGIEGGWICEQCGDAECVDLACMVRKADLIRAVFPNEPGDQEAT